MINKDVPKLVGEAIAPLVSTVDKNWDREESDPLCQRIVYTTKIESNKADIFRRVARDRIVSFVQEVDDYLIGLEAETPEPVVGRDGEELLRLGVGAYYFEVERDD